MRFLLFPCDLEGVGSYRLLYPYGTMETRTDHTVEIRYAGDQLTDSKGKTLLEFPAAAVAGPHTELADEFLTYDVFVLQRPLEKIYAPIAAWLKQNGKTVVVDIDDWFGGIPGGNQGKQEIENSARHSIETIERVLRYADIVTVTTPTLQHLYGTDARVLPNYLLKRDWQDLPPVHELDRGKVRVGWQGWLNYRGKDLNVLKKAIPKLLRKHPEVVFVNVGKPDVIQHLHLPEGRYIHVDGAMFPNHAPRVHRIDIGLVPLEANVFNDCKSSLKAQEYGACGAPFIASPSLPNQEWCDETNGLLARLPREWADALDHMLTDDNWRQMGRANHEKSWGNMIDDHWPRWQGLFQ